MVIDHNDRMYRLRWNFMGDNRWNGAFYYSKEIVENIIPNVSTDRNWVTVNERGRGADHSIVFVHNNLHPEHYEWLKKYDDVILVCGVPETVGKVEHIHRAIYLPLSIDVDYVKKFEREKDRDTAFFGRPGKSAGYDFGDADVVSGMRRDKMLAEMARYRKGYCVGRCALEFKALGGEVLPYDPRYPDPGIWQVLDNKDAAKILQEELDRIDGR